MWSPGSSFVRGIAKPRCAAPFLEERCCPLNGGTIEAVGKRVLHGCDQRRRRKATCRIEDVAESERVTDEEDLLVAGAPPQPSANRPPPRRGSRRPPGPPSGGRLPPTPGTVERPFVEGAEVDLVEIGDDDGGDSRPSSAKASVSDVRANSGTPSSTPRPSRPRSARPARCRRAEAGPGHDEASLPGSSARGRARGTAAPVRRGAIGSRARARIPIAS